MVVLILSAGCSQFSTQKAIQLVEETQTPIAAEEPVTELKLTEEGFRAFFNDYFSFTEEALLVLKPKHQATDEAYWDSLTEDYRPLIQQKLGSYMAEELLTKLETQYLYDEMDLPKEIQLNNYRVAGEAKVHDIQINAIRQLEDQFVYEIVVVTTHKCYPENQGYLFSSEEDEMKLEQHFLVTAKAQNPLKITSIKHATSWGVNAVQKQDWLDSQYITRVPYEIAPTTDEITFLTNLFTTLMQAPRGTYEYYRVAYETSASALLKMWENLGFEQGFKINQDDYQMAFSPILSPYKDEINTLTVYKEHLQIKPSVYSTKRQPRFIVTIPVEALLNNYQIVYYNYQYYVGMEENKVEFIQFIKMEPADKIEDINALSDEELILDTQ